MTCTVLFGNIGSLSQWQDRSDTGDMIAFDNGCTVMNRRYLSKDGFENLTGNLTTKWFASTFAALPRELNPDA